MWNNDPGNPNTARSLPLSPQQSNEENECHRASVCVLCLLTKAITQRFVHKAECVVHHHTLIKSPNPSEQM